MATLRITAGTLRGRRVTVPPHDVRPTSERARQAFFNIVGARIVGARFLDLFAGSGIFSFEAVSRGAASATAVEKDRRNAAAIANLAKGWQQPVTVVAEDAFTAMRRLRDAFDVVFVDPPYDFERYDDLLDTMDADLRLTNDAVIAFEHRRRTEPLTRATRNLSRVRRAEYGEVWLTFFTKGHNGPSSS